MGDGSDHGKAWDSTYSQLMTPKTMYFRVVQAKDRVPGHTGPSPSN